MSSQSSAGRSVSPGKNLTRIGSKGKGFIWRENWYNRPRSWRCFRASAWDWTKASIVYLTIRIGLLHPRAKMLCLIQHGFILYHKFFSTDWCIGLKWVKGQGAAASASATTKDCPNGKRHSLDPKWPTFTGPLSECSRWFYCIPPLMHVSLQCTLFFKKVLNM